MIDRYINGRNTLFFFKAQKRFELKPAHLARGFRSASPIHILERGVRI